MHDFDGADGRKRDDVPAYDTGRERTEGNAVQENCRVLGLTTAVESTHDQPRLLTHCAGVKNYQSGYVLKSIGQTLHRLAIQSLGRQSVYHRGVRAQDSRDPVSGNYYDGESLSHRIGSIGLRERRRTGGEKEKRRPFSPD